MGGLRGFGRVSWWGMCLLRGLGGCWWRLGFGGWRGIGEIRSDGGLRRSSVHLALGIRYHGVLAPRQRAHRLAWAVLLARVFAIEVSQWPTCGGTTRLVAAALDSAKTTRCTDCCACNTALQLLNSFTTVQDEQTRPIPTASMPSCNRVVNKSLRHRVSFQLKLTITPLGGIHLTGLGICYEAWITLVLGYTIRNP